MNLIQCVYCKKLFEHSLEGSCAFLKDGDILFFDEYACLVNWYKEGGVE